MSKLKHIHPGEILLEEFLKPLEISAYRLSKETFIPQTRISEIIKIAVSVPQSGDCPIQFFDFKGNNWELVASISHEAEFNTLGISITMNPGGGTFVGTSRSPEGFAVIYSLDELNEPLFYSIEVFDRRGNLIYKNDKATTNNMTDGWSPGNNTNQGVCVYRIRYNNGENEVVLSGDITLIK